jgi:hypothetical protein
MRAAGSTLVVGELREEIARLADADEVLVNGQRVDSAEGGSTGVVLEVTDLPVVEAECEQLHLYPEDEKRYQKIQDALILAVRAYRRTLPPDPPGDCAQVEELVEKLWPLQPLPKLAKVVPA